MKRSTTAVIVGVLALGLVGGGTAMALSNSGEPAPEASMSAPAPVVSDAPVEASTDAPVTPAPTVEADPVADAGYLAEVERRTPPETVLGNFTDAELIAMGHEGCKQIGEGAILSELRLVEGEQPAPSGYWLDTSAVFNSALLNYCRDLIDYKN